MHGDHSV